MSDERQIIHDGPHTREVLTMLSKSIPSKDSLLTITEKAGSIIKLSVDPIGGQPEEPNDGLLYGLIQSGKTSILTVTAAMAADNGFQNLIILTADNNELYRQTLDRIKEGIISLSILGKNEWGNPIRFERQLRTFPFAVVCSKNSQMLQGLLEAYRRAGAKGLSTFIIDDEADLASLNTNERRREERDPSAINRAISDIRRYFPVNTYLQVTATPQALFLQRPDGRYRPSFTVLSEPGPGYVGGEAFFGDEPRLLRYVDLEEVDQLHATFQPQPSGEIPIGLLRSLCVYLIGGTYKYIQESEMSAFLCHVSHTRIDHDYLENLIHQFKEDMINGLANDDSRLINFLLEAYNDISGTQIGLPPFEDLLKKIKLYLPGGSIKLVNSVTNNDISLNSVFNFFVGGNKLGRGVTIKNLLVSYYGRNPRRPNADTVLQHARMYGYRQKDIGITRLFLPEILADHFRSIHQMESSLRDIILKYPEGKFEGIFIHSPLQATRNNVLDPSTIGAYAAGSSYNPTYPLRTEEIKANTEWIDNRLSDIGDYEAAKVVSIDLIKELISKCIVDPGVGADLWNIDILLVALEQVKGITGDKAYLVIRRDRNLNARRTESQGIIGQNEGGLAQTDAPTLFLYRSNRNSRGENEVWWPQLRFPEGNFVIAFSFER